MANEIFVLITERDCPNPLESCGPIVHEQYCSAARFPQNLDERARSFNGKYGKAWIARLADITEVNITEQEPAQ